MLTMEAVLEKALALSPTERVQLIDDLVASIQPYHHPAVDAAWAAEIRSRLAAYDRGELETISLEELKQQLASE